MAALGRFDKEFELYGCTYWEDGKIYYCISQYQEAVQQFIAQCAQKHIYPTPLERYVKRIAVPAGMEEELLAETKLEMAAKMQRQYGKRYFEAMLPFMQAEPNDAAYPFLQQFADTIEGYFQADALQIFAGTVQMAYEAKILTDSGYMQFQQWLAENRRQIEDDPVISADVDRTLYGICYEDTGQLPKFFIDAQKKAVIDKKQQLELQGLLVTPVYAKRYEMKNFGEMPAARKSFRAKMERYYGEWYFNFIKNLKSLSGVIEQDMLQDLQQQFIQTGAGEAADAVRYYQYRWNGKQ